MDRVVAQLLAEIDGVQTGGGGALAPSHFLPHAPEASLPEPGRLAALLLSALLAHVLCCLAAQQNITEHDRTPWIALSRPFT